VAAECGAPPSWVGIAAPGLAARDGRGIAWMRGRLDALQGSTGRTPSTSPHGVGRQRRARALLGEAWLGRGGGAARRGAAHARHRRRRRRLVDGRLLAGHAGRAGTSGT
jgi:glucokinase